MRFLKNTLGCLTRAFCHVCLWIVIAFVLSMLLKADGGMAGSILFCSLTFCIFLALIVELIILPKRARKQSAVEMQEKTVSVIRGSAKEETFDPARLDPYEYEKYVAQMLIQRGYQSTDVTPQSGDYGVDILAVSAEGWKVAVQCKRYAGSVGISAVQEVITGREYYSCDLAMIVTTGTYTQQAMNVARKTHVKLYILDKDGWRAAS